MNGTLLELYRHKTWATLRLIKFCQGIDPEHLGEEGYFRLVTGERLAEPLPEGHVHLDELARRIRLLGPRWETPLLIWSQPGQG